MDNNLGMFRWAAELVRDLPDASTPHARREQVDVAISGALDEARLGDYSRARYGYDNRCGPVVPTPPCR